jgi:hypothetical protein
MQVIELVLTSGILGFVDLMSFKVFDLSFFIINCAPLGFCVTFKF